MTERDEFGRPYTQRVIRRVKPRYKDPREPGRKDMCPHGETDPVGAGCCRRPIQSIDPLSLIEAMEDSAPETCMWHAGEFTPCPVCRVECQFPDFDPDF